MTALDRRRTLNFTQEDLENAGYDIPAAPEDDWRDYDECRPVPGSFQFDWLSSRHPDLYHCFSLSSIGLMRELEDRFDLTGLEVADIGAGTGRISLEAARKAKKVTAVDVFESVAHYGRRMADRAGLKNVAYLRGDSRHLPLRDNSMDAALCAWALIDYPEAYRVLKPDGCLIDLLPAPGALCGELTPLLASIFPDIVTEVAPARHLEPDCPDSDFVIQEDSWNGIPVRSPIRVHDFTYTADYGDCAEAAAIYGRLYGPEARRYLQDRNQSTMFWRLRIVINRVRKT